MKRSFWAILLTLGACTSAQINQTLNQVSKAAGTEKALTTAEVGDGLKEALTSGIAKGADQLSATDGYFKNPEIKIPFPPDVKKVEDKLRQIGMDKQVDNFIMTLNRGAEDAAKEAKPIFVNAIKQMTIEDAWGILNGDVNAATSYLERTTSPQLKEKFKPVIQNSLDKVGAARYYTDLVNTYNKIPFVEKVNPDLNEYATNLAMKGLFMQIAKEEKKIRQDPAARTTDLLVRVFSQAK